MNLEILIGLPQYEITGIEQCGGELNISAVYTGARSCPECGATQLRNKGLISRTVRHDTKMEVLQRQAYGFRNFNNYRLRVKVLCS